MTMPRADGYTLVPTWVSQSPDIDTETYVVLVAICHQRQWRQDQPLSLLTPFSAAKVRRITSDLLRRRLIVQHGIVFDVPAERPL